jgi:hypothetical protein
VGTAKMVSPTEAIIRIVDRELLNWMTGGLSCSLYIKPHTDDSKCEQNESEEGTIWRVK